MYAWLAMQRVIDRPLVGVGGPGTLAFFLSTLGFALAGDLPLTSATQAFPDLLLVAVSRLVGADGASVQSDEALRTAFRR